MEWKGTTALPFLMEMLLIVRHEDGTILQASHSFKQLTGYGAPPSPPLPSSHSLSRVYAPDVETPSTPWEHPIAATGGRGDYSATEIQPQRLEDYVDEEERVVLRCWWWWWHHRCFSSEESLTTFTMNHSTNHLHHAERTFGTSTKGEDVEEEEDEDGGSTRTSSSSRRRSSSGDDPQATSTSTSTVATSSEHRMQCRLVTAGGSRLWIAWTGRRRGGLVLLSGVLVPRGRRHSLATEDGQQLARSLAVATAAAAVGMAAASTAGSTVPTLPALVAPSSTPGARRLLPAVSSPRSTSISSAMVAVVPPSSTTTEMPHDQASGSATATVAHESGSGERVVAIEGAGGGQSQTLEGLLQLAEKLQEEQRALIEVLAELFPGVLIARIALPTLNYTFANSAFCLRYGELKRHDASTSGYQTKVLGRPVEAVRGQDAASVLKPHIENCVQQGRQVSFDIRVPPPPPLPPYMFNSETDQEEQMQTTLIPDLDSTTGEVRGIFEIIQSTSKGERRQAAEELEYQAHITQTITQNAASCLFMMDHKGFPTFMNLAAERVTGYKLDEIKNKPLHYAVHWKRPDNTFYPMEECPIDNSSVELVPAQDVEEVFVRKDGTIFPVICAVAPLSKGGRTVGAVIEFRDVTEERKREAERLSALRAAEEHQRKRAAEAEEFRVKQERFIDTVCHELRNPLNGIYGNITLLQDELDTVREQVNEVDWAGKSKVNESLQQMQICIDSMSTCARHQKVITDDVLHLSKLEANKIELNKVIFNPMEVINSAVSMFMSQIQTKKLALRVKEPVARGDSSPDEQHVLVVRGDPDRFMQVLVNLISNAIKFTHVGGITISIAYAHRDHEATELRVDVADTGIGMSKEEQSRIFDRFSQASHKTYREYGGSGLGLSITKGLVTLMGGSVTVDSKAGNGSVFSFNVVCGYVTPQQLEQHTLEKERHKQNQTRRSKELRHFKTKLVKPKRILVAEDNSINRRVISRFLQRRGHHCEAADNGEEAIDLFLEALGKGRPFDLAFMDIEMPVMDGISATQLIRERERALNVSVIPIIGLSGNSRQQQIEAALSSGMSDYITKPYEQETIFSKIEYWTQKMQGDKSAEGSDQEEADEEEAIRIARKRSKDKEIEDEEQEVLQSPRPIRRNDSEVDR